MTDFNASTKAKDKDEENFKAIKAALDLGINYFDTSDIYGMGDNEELLGRAMQKFGREKFFVGEKIGIMRGPDGAFKGPNGTREYLRKSVELGLQRLQTTYIDLVYFNRFDPNVTIEETMGALSEMVKEGKIKYLGLSEASTDQIRRAHAIHPISALQTEYSLWCLDIESKVLPTCRELGISIMAYSPLGKGFLTGKIQKYEDLSADDYRRHWPRFSPENFPKNIHMVHKIEEIAKSKNCTPAQLALAWLLAVGNDIFPLFGTTRAASIEENAGAVNVKLTPEEVKKIHEIADVEVYGTRYPEFAMKMIGTDK